MEHYELLTLASAPVCDAIVHVRARGCKNRDPIRFLARCRKRRL